MRPNIRRGGKGERRACQAREDQINFPWLRPAIQAKVPSTLIRFQTKTEQFCSRYGYRPHYNAENDHRKRSHSKRCPVERYENDAFWKRCFLVWPSSVDGENDAIWKRWRHQIDTTGRQTTRPWVSKMADKRYHVASLLIGMTSSLLTLLQAHLTQLRRHIDFTKRKQDILRLLTLPASGKTKIKWLSLSPLPVLDFGCFPAVLGIV